MRLFILASLLSAINAVLRIIKSSSELEIVAKNYSCNRLSICERKFWSRCRVFFNTAQRHCSEKNSARTIHSLLLALICSRFKELCTQVAVCNTPRRSQLLTSNINLAKATSYDDADMVYACNGEVPLKSRSGNPHTFPIY